MAVKAVWQCDRDGTMFEHEKDAEEHDKLLELAANITYLLEQTIPGLNEEHGEAIGLALAQRREVLAQACKGKPSLLLEALVADGPTDISEATGKVSKMPRAANGT